MTRAARVFSQLCLALIALGIVAMIWLSPAPTPVYPLPAPLTGAIDRIQIEKSARRLTLWQNGVPVRRYDVALGFNPEGDKEIRGDGRTPEGRFHIDRRNDRSGYHLSLGLDYPQPDDVARARAGGQDPGGDIFIHGQPNALPDAVRLKGDWTAGCIALTNAEMREIWPAIPIGTPVDIDP
jgi:murein L,D-transpeptidase YafK